MTKKGWLNNMDDCVSRAEAIRLIDMERKEPHLIDNAEDGLLEARRIINTLPSVQPERPKGEWIDVTKKIGFPEDMCSECHLRASRWMRFCPNCGADMRTKEVQDV